MNIVKAAVTVGSFTLVSRVLGFVRDLMIASVLGASAMADSFFVSFKLANLFRRLFAEGAFNAAFVPLFARTLEGEGEDEARRFAREALAIMTTVLLVVVLMALLAMPYLVRVLAPGFAPDGERYGLAVELSRITFPYLMFISLAALFSGILNSIGQFAAAAFAPIILNLVLISALLLANLHPETPAHALAWGVFVAGILQLAWVAVAVRRNGMAIRLQRPRVTPRIKRLFKLMLPGAIGSGVYQVNLVIDMWFASLLPVGAVSYLFYADRLNQLPLGIIGIAIGTALLPMLSRQFRSGQDQAASHTQNRAIEMGLLLTLPAAAALIVLATPIITVLFERDAFHRRRHHSHGRRTHGVLHWPASLRADQGAGAGLLRPGGHGDPGQGGGGLPDRQRALDPGADRPAGACRNCARHGPFQCRERDAAHRHPAPAWSSAA